MGKLTRAAKLDNRASVKAVRTAADRDRDAIAAQQEADALVEATRQAQITAYLKRVEAIKASYNIPDRARVTWR
jgi:hypothetical protein